MNALTLMAIAIAGLIPGVAVAQDSLRLGDVQVVQSPAPARYQPDSTDYDLADRGKTFDIDCLVAPDGRMHDCQALPNNMYDQNFVRIGVDNARGFVVATRARDGTPTAGRTLSLTCKFSRTDGSDGDVAAKDADDAGTGRTDVAANDQR